MVEAMAMTSSPDPVLAAQLKDNPGGVLERTAEEHGVSTLEVVRALPSEYRTLVPGFMFEEVMADLTSWGDVLLIVHTPGIVLECKGSIPPGTFGRGYFNIHGDSPIGGHIKADNCQCIAFVSRPFMGRHSCSIQFFDEVGSAIFKVFVRRDDARELLLDQVAKFENLREKVCD
jgi:heme iron utilization protein